MTIGKHLCQLIVVVSFSRGEVGRAGRSEFPGSARFQGSGSRYVVVEKGSEAGSKCATIYALPRFLDFLLKAQPTLLK